VGTLSLVLRNQIDRKEVDTRGIMKRQLLTGDTVQVETKPAEPAKPQPAKVVYRTQPAAAPSEKKTDKVEVIKGVHKADVAF
jgi:Flp pilus assembly protein CpaB